MHKKSTAFGCSASSLCLLQMSGCERNKTLEWINEHDLARIQLKPLIRRTKNILVTYFLIKITNKNYYENCNARLRKDGKEN